MNISERVLLGIPEADRGELLNVVDGRCPRCTSSPMRVFEGALVWSCGHGVYLPPIGTAKEVKR